jgi:hypothetical protein
MSSKPFMIRLHDHAGVNMGMEAWRSDIAFSPERACRRLWMSKG